MRGGRAGRGRSSKAIHPPEFYACPSCGAGVHWVGWDIRKKDVFECDACRRRVGKSTLEYQERHRPVLD